MGNDDRKTKGDRSRELLLAMSKLDEPFTTRDVIAIAKVKSSVNHFLIQFVASKYIEVERVGKHNQPYSYRRTGLFPIPSELVPQQKPKPPQSVHKRSKLEVEYWQMRDSFNIKPKNDDELYE